MYSPLLNIAMQYGACVLAGIVAALIFKAFFSQQVQRKIRGYQADIVKSHSKILELEAKNDQLEKRLKDYERNFVKDKLLMN